MSTTDKPYLLKSEILSRGWTRPIMSKYLPPKKPFPSTDNPKCRLYAWPRDAVLKAETKAAVRAVISRRQHDDEKAQARLVAREERWDYTLKGILALFIFKPIADDISTPNVTHLAELLHTCFVNAVAATPFKASGLCKSMEEAAPAIKYFLRPYESKKQRNLSLVLRKLYAAVFAISKNRSHPLTDALLAGYSAALVTLARQLIEDFESKNTGVSAPELFAMEPFPVNKLMDSTLYRLYLIAYIPKAIQSTLTNLIAVDPINEYPEARMMNRKFIIHIGGTNTGKTYQALQRLRQAKAGVYLSPLRLLALEVQETLLADGFVCSLLTGEEEDIIQGATHISSTVEKLSLGHKYDVAVIDECQMIGEGQRGFAWTRAILGCLATEIHLCAAPEALSILTRLIDSCGDSYTIQRHERSVPLVYCREPIHIKDVQSGDAYVAFSKKDVLTIADDLRERGYKVAIIYGALPYATRRLQMERFLNHEADILVATDAIGMGLNLPIRRIVFMDDTKFDGITRRELLPAEVKQIAGRAGRFGIYDVGYVGSREDSPIIREGLAVANKPTSTAYLGFSDLILRVDQDLLSVLQVWNSMSTIEPYTRISIDRHIYIINSLIQQRLNFSKEELLRATTIPFDESNPRLMEIFLSYATAYVEGIAIPRPTKEGAGLSELEFYCKWLDLYYSFSHSFGNPDYRNSWVKREKEHAAIQINSLLLEEAKHKSKACRVCGMGMPADSKYSICDSCHRKRMSKNRTKKTMRVIA